MFYCNKLPFGIIPRNRFLNIKTMNIISFYNEDEIAFYLKWHVKNIMKKHQKVIYF